ncbi:MarR family transcriptional regulator [Antarctobacter sp.]|uniref:MarR family winged helix-turn-helix transcriptional regulator n=1 Tax=Antarctobacter sp. TaxID=1872577 RepID=UPI002B279930|nr:MarR family transcriptional regulator [Antarctobacter sp.]
MIDERIEPTTPLESLAGHLIRRLHQTSTQVFQSQTKAAGLDLTPVQFAAMKAVHEAPGIDQASLAARIAYDRATIGGVIDRLEQKGWVQRTISLRDRRAREVTLTKAGKRVFAEALPVVQDLQADILPGLSPDEHRLFLELAQKSTLGRDSLASLAP